MNIKLSSLNPVLVENFYAYPHGHKHYGKLKLKFNHNPFELNEEIKIETEQAIIVGTIEFMEKDVVVMKMKELIHKELPS